MHCEEKLKLRSHNTSYYLIEVVTKYRHKPNQTKFGNSIKNNLFAEKIDQLMDITHN
jgi:hypothetical protein